MVDTGKFNPRTVYVTYIAATPERVWPALADPAFSTKYSFRFAVEVEPKAGGNASDSHQFPVPQIWRKLI